MIREKTYIYTVYTPVALPGHCQLDKSPCGPVHQTCIKASDSARCYEIYIIQEYIYIYMGIYVYMGIYIYEYIYI